MMDKGDASDFKLWLSAICAAFCRDADTATYHAYWVGLRDCDRDKVKNAMAAAISECVRMPSPAELRIMMGHISPQHSAAIAWGYVLGAISEYGPWQSVDFADPITNASIRSIGGWRSICSLPDRDLRYAARDFEKSYIAHCQSPPPSRLCAHLVGRAEQHNASGGWPVDPPETVGMPDVPQRAVLPPAEEKKKLSGRARELVGKCLEK